MEKIALIDIDDTSIPVDEIIQAENQEELKLYPKAALANGLVHSSYPELKALTRIVPCRW